MPRIQPPHRLLSDERLATLARAGDADAFTVLYARHEAALLGYCRSITRDPEDARDALQTALAHAYAGFDAKPPGAPVRAWLFRIAHNESVNVLRRRRSDVPLDDGDLSAASAADETVKRAAAHELLAEVARLPVRQRGALVLRELQGLAYGEIAAALAVTEANARQLVFAARSGLQESHAGRRLPCELVRDVIEVGDRRAQRRRGMRAHLHVCRDCREFASAVAPQRRRAAFALPGWLAGWGGVAHSAGTGGAGVTAGAGETVTSMAAKGVAIVAVAAATAGATAQHRPANPETEAKVHVAAKRTVVAKTSHAAPTRRTATAAHKPSSLRTVAVRTSAPARPIQRTVRAPTTHPIKPATPSPGRGLTPRAGGDSGGRASPQRHDDRRAGDWTPAAFHAGDRQDAPGSRDLAARGTIGGGDCDKAPDGPSAAPPPAGAGADPAPPGGISSEL